MSLEINNIYKSYYENGKKFDVLKDISFSVDNNEFVSIVGSSGCGKTTLLKQIAGFETVDFGEIKINDRKVIKPSSDAIMIFQDFDQLFPWKTVINNIVFALKANGIGTSNQERVNISKRYLKMTKLSEASELYPHKLSGGMKQRASLARALALTPKVLLMDEPFGSLDAQTRAQLQKLLINICNETKVTILFVTHDIQEAMLLSDRIIVMNKNDKKISKIIDNSVKQLDSKCQQYIDLYEEIYQLLS